eukprot:gb/GFBE01061832.1/.p1 GENE.gb/GFBE01061832.1/~~gb/GFBE01061832.1/.p1  ORF type:complete len:253 (+),score=64.25 gb/GFBE01061832.1/:1-759(+)
MLKSSTMLRMVREIPELAAKGMGFMTQAVNIREISGFAADLCDESMGACEKVRSAAMFAFHVWGVGMLVSFLHPMLGNLIAAIGKANPVTLSESMSDGFKALQTKTLKKLAANTKQRLCSAAQASTNQVYKDMVHISMDTWREVANEPIELGDCDDVKECKEEQANLKASFLVIDADEQAETSWDEELAWMAEHAAAALNEDPCVMIAMDEALSRHNAPDSDDPSYAAQAGLFYPGTLGGIHSKPAECMEVA